MQSTASVEVRGRVEQVVGTIIRAVVPGVKVGELCILRNPWEDWTLRAEVVGFVKQVALLTPLGDFAGHFARNRSHPDGGNPFRARGRRSPRARPERARRSHRRRAAAQADPLSGLRRSPEPMLRKIIDRPISLGLRVLGRVLTCGEGQRMGYFRGGWRR